MDKFEQVEKKEAPLPGFEEIVDKKTINEKAEELSDKMAEKVKGQITVWVKNTLELTLKSSDGKLDHETVSVFMNQMAIHASSFLKDIAPITEEATNYFTENIDKVIINKYQEFINSAIEKEISNTEKMTERVESVKKWYEKISEENEKYYKEYYDKFFNRLGESISNFIKEISEEVRNRAR
jgi:hypothetical protein